MAVDAAVLQQAAQTIQAGSKSFATAARLFDETTRQSAVLLYAWCRHCDDVIDGQQLGHGQQQGDRSDSLAQLATLEQATRLACAGEPTDDPVFAGLAEVIRRHGIAEHYLLEHLAGFRMDVEARDYACLDDTLAYCWRVAGVVGVMMAMVMGNHNPATLDRACDLGMAFQLTNIARDVVEDAAIGRDAAGGRPAVRCAGAQAHDPVATHGHPSVMDHRGEVITCEHGRAMNKQITWMHHNVASRSQSRGSSKS